MATQTDHYDLRKSPNAGAHNATGDEIDIDIRSLFLMFWRRKTVILGVLLIGFSLAAVLISMIQPRYSARSMILIETNAPVKGADEVLSMMSNLRVDNALMLSELEVLRSRNMARKVVEHLNLMSDPEFNMALKRDRSGLMPSEQNQDNANFKPLNLYQSELEKLPPEMVERQIEQVVTVFLNNLSVRSIPGSFAISIEYTSVNPFKAAKIANTIADLYIEQRLETKFKATQKVTDWLDKRLSSLRKQVIAAELAVENFRTENNLAVGARTFISAEQLSAMSSQLAEARAKHAEAQARLQQVNELVENPDEIENTAEIVNSNLIQRFKQEEAALQRRLSELSTRYGPKHPAIIDVKSQLKKMRSSMREEMQKIAKSTESELRVAKARLESLEENMAEIQGARDDDNEAMVKLRELEREAESTRLIYDTFLKTYKKSDEQEELQEAEVRIISYAVAPRDPSYPNKMMLLSLSAAVALFIGLAISLFLEKLDNTFRSANQLEKTLGFSCYALIPMLENMTRKEVGRYILSKPSSTLAEAIRTLRMVVNLRAPKNAPKPKVITVTSSFPNEGKTTLSTWISRLSAKSGEKVIVIDCDLRRPSLARSMGNAHEHSLVDYLTGKKELEDVVYKDTDSGAHVIYGDSVPNSALDLVSSEKMAALITSLRQVYDLVIIDSPACLAVSDARVLANMSDQTLYAVAWDETPREVVLGGVKQFTDIGYNSLALVLSKVDIKRHVRYGYGDTVYYYGRNKEYYTE